MLLQENNHCLAAAVTPLNFLSGFDALPGLPVSAPSGILVWFSGKVSAPTLTCMRSSLYKALFTWQEIEKTSWLTHAGWAGAGLIVFIKLFLCLKVLSLFFCLFAFVFDHTTCSTATKTIWEPFRPEGLFFLDKAASFHKITILTAFSAFFPPQKRGLSWQFISLAELVVCKVLPDLAENFHLNYFEVLRDVRFNV